MSMDIATWKECVLSTIVQIGDREFQERVWLRGDGPEVSSWEEIICTLYGDCQFKEFIEECLALGVHLNLVNELRVFGIKLDSYLQRTPETMPASDVLQDPEWATIVEHAQRIGAKTWTE